MLGFLGANGENTDVLAHLTGFTCGVGCGLVFARTYMHLKSSALQWISGTVGTAVLAGAWMWALTATGALK
jgi:hypothetical protein